MHIVNDEILETHQDGIASVVMKSRITEQDGEIVHEIDAFCIQAIDEKICDTLFEHPSLTELKKYFYKETDLNIEFAEEDEWLLVNEPENEVPSNKIRC